MRTTVVSTAALIATVGCAPEAVDSPSPAQPETRVAADARAQPEPNAALLAAHNAARAQVGVPPLAWSEEVADTARGWARELGASGCALEHSRNQPYGENLYWTSAPTDGADVTRAWVAEASHYDARDHTCARGQVCGHYTQVVWGNTRKLGCGVATCGSAQVWVCNYDPPGNYAGQTPF